MRLEQLDEAALVQLGAELASRIPEDGICVHLVGSLGAGKTTLVRAMLRALGHTGTVRSPTYTLIEPYDVAGRDVYHLDLYRLADPEELEYVGIRDLSVPGASLLIEWPEKGAGRVPAPDLFVVIERPSISSRNVRLEARSGVGVQVLEDMKNMKL